MSADIMKRYQEKPKNVAANQIRPLNILTRKQFQKQSKETRIIYAVVVRQMKGPATTANVEMQPEISRLLSDFSDVAPEELTNELPPMHDIQHAIDLVPGSQLPNLRAHIMNPTEHAELQRQAEDLLSKGSVRESLSPCAAPAVQTPKKDGTWGMYINSCAINKLLSSINSDSMTR